MAKKTASTDDDVIVIKKYANRRLYNTATSSYVTLDHLCEMVKKGKDFVVHDAKTNEDITRSVLAQIIFEEEGKSGQNLLPIKFLRQLIRFYGDSLQGFIPSYLELSMDAFSREQEKMRSKIASAFTGGARLGQFEDQIRQNFAMFDSAMRMFSPFAPRGKPARTGGEEEGPEPEAGGTEAEPNAREREIEDLKRQMAAMQSQLESLVKK
ncbi:polyhydroxyalkanoate synthesis repressor PhaR [Parvibaculum sp.]|uniref:polyhydroxyalkanoate synthesis repressor PhaR n=1 Tax=Parvibaculum sp. TaxID=2024848 RepID=UPI002C38DDA6|nr:polyhydroxyalkanoate synthesis repressor PhaR [Parvibaculum sp.]HUD52347.1 polyhydroxyalkanoate synthesis repressor PhaR [Parvibaculum sp.]